jgi:hypothetical protein
MDVTLDISHDSEELGEEFGVHLAAPPSYGSEI